MSCFLGSFYPGRLNTNEDNENMLGYELYSSALADMLSEPSLSMPITVGLYAKWGSGKSFLLNKLRGTSNPSIFLIFLYYIFTVWSPNFGNIQYFFGICRRNERICSSVDRTGIEIFHDSVRSGATRVCSRRHHSRYISSFLDLRYRGRRRCILFPRNIPLHCLLGNQKV